MDKPQECKILSELLNETPSCQDFCSFIETPSYMDDLTPKGCLLAHLALTLIEMQRVSSHFKIPLSNLFAQNEVEVNYCWNMLLTSSLLHDIGKLVDEYVTRQNYVSHHQISAIIAKKTLGSISNNSIALKIAYAILFHHEAMDWKAVHKSLLLFSYLQKVLSPTQKILYNVSQNRLDKFKQNIYRLLDQVFKKGIITKSQHQILNKASVCALHELNNNQKHYLYVVRELDVMKIQELKYLTPALALYRLLYISDNRAASARDKYWLRLIQQVDWERLDDIAWQISHFLTKRYYYIGLSSIPPSNCRSMENICSTV